MSDKTENYNKFIHLNRELLDCYALMMNPNAYKELTAAQQRDFCYS